MSSIPTEQKPAEPVAAPDAAAPATNADGTPKLSKKELNKLAAKAKKAAEKAKQTAGQLTSKVADLSLEDPSKESYGRVTTDFPEGFSSDAPLVSLSSLSDEHDGKTVVVRAWIQNTRSQSAKMMFMELREEGTWTIQGLVVANVSAESSTPPEGKPAISRQMVKYINAINPESFVAVEATVLKPKDPVKSCRVSGFELHITKCYVLAPAPPALGLTLQASNQAIVDFGDQEKKPGEEDTKESESAAPTASMLTHLNNIAMHKRAPVQQAIADIRIEVKDLFRSYLKSHQFKEFEPPCLIGAASEGGANVFRLPYFSQEAFLAQSPQFYKQFEIAGGRKRVFSIGPVFRAENSNTPRHMTEFTGLDMEMEIKKDYSEVLYTLEGVLLHIFRGIKERCQHEIDVVRGVYPSEELLLPEPGKEVRLSFANAQKLLREEGPEEYRNVRDDEDMSTAQEKALGAVVRTKYNTDFYVIDKFPDTARPFYAKVDPASKPSADGVRATNAFDFFLRGQEILSGGQRINDPEELEARIRSKGVDPASAGIKDYVNVFRQVGVPAHGGGGIGLDRVVAWYLALPSVHLAAYYPRTPKRLLP